jgi:hypothetical protein
MGDSPLLADALARIDAINAADPRTTQVGDRTEPKELLYSRRMSAALERFSPGASESLRLAARAQHIARWKIPRSSYPEGRDGYRAWRTKLQEVQAELAAEVLRGVGYAESTILRVMSLLRKESLKRDPEVQILEDVACIVFLEHYFEEFARDRAEDQLVGILKKTLAKMSLRGREAALFVELDSRGKRLLAQALGRAGSD